jgi:hypothetical protein
MTIFSSAPYNRHLQFTFFSEGEAPSFTPAQKTGKVVVTHYFNLYVFTLLTQNWKAKDSEMKHIQHSPN